MCEPPQMAQQYQHRQNAKPLKQWKNCKKTGNIQTQRNECGKTAKKEMRQIHWTKQNGNWNGARSLWVLNLRAQICRGLLGFVCFLLLCCFCSVFHSFYVSLLFLIVGCFRDLCNRPCQPPYEAPTSNIARHLHSPKNWSNTADLHRQHLGLS